MKLAIVCVLLLTLYVTYCQETAEDIRQKQAEEKNIKDEKTCRFIMSDGQHLTLKNMMKQRAPDYVFRKYHDESRFTYYFNI